MADEASDERSSTGGQHDEAPIFGRCPRCGTIVEEAFDYDVQGNELFCCGRIGCRTVFAQDKIGAYVIHEDGSTLS